MTQLVSTLNGWFDLSGIQNFFKSLWISYKSYNAYKQTINELSRLSNKELNDIGINRGMIRSIAMEVYFDNLKEKV
jgi:uncharacterized protein YjiS (DUF1127 family)